MNEEPLMKFDDLPLGTRFRYPDGDKVWVILKKWREISDDEPMHGRIAEWRDDATELGKWPGQSICSHVPGECPEMVIVVDPVGDTKIDGLIKALMIAKKYENPSCPTHCEHDVMWLCINESLVSDEDKEKLDKLGFFVADDGFQSHRYGSA